MVDLRPAHEDDAEIIAAIYVDSWNQGFGHLLGKRRHTSQRTDQWRADLASKTTSWLNADIDDLGFERGHHILRITRKGGKGAVVPLAPRTARAVRLYIGERASGPIFLGTSGQRMDRHAADRAVKRLARRAGIKKRISPDSFITAALDAGVPLRDVQDAASHSDPRTTMRYDRARHSLDRHATYVVSTFIAATAGPPAPGPTTTSAPSTFRDTCYRASRARLNAGTRARQTVIPER